MKDAKRGGGRRSSESKSLGLLATSVRGWCRVCITMLRWAQDGIQHRLPNGVAPVDADPDAIVAVCNRILANRRDALAKHRADIARAPSADSDADAKKRMQKLVSQVAVLEHLAAHVSDSAPKSARQRAHVMSNPPAPPIDSADLEEADDDDGSSSASRTSDSESDSHSGGAHAAAGEASADAAKLKLLLERSGSDIPQSALPKAESSSSVKSAAAAAAAALPKAESGKSATAAATSSRPPPPVAARRSSTDGPLTKTGTTSPSPSDVVDAVVKSSTSPSPPIPTQAASPPPSERGSDTRSSAGSAAGDGSPVIKPKAAAAAAATTTTTTTTTTANSGAAPAAAGAKDAKDAGGMFSNMRKALARPSLGGLMRGKAKPKATPMFGVSLVEAATAGGGVLPLPLLHAADVLVQRKLVDREGIFRLTGSIATINQIKELYNNDGSREAHQLMTDEGNAHTIAGVLKLWLRELPERLIPNVLLENVGSAARDVDRLLLIIDVIKRLPAHNRVALQKLCWVLHNVWQHREANKMGVRNLSVVFAPFVLGLGRVSELMETLIRFYRFAFGIEPVPESDEALSAIMIEQFDDHTPTLSATAAAKAAKAAAASSEVADDEAAAAAAAAAAQEEEDEEAPVEEAPIDEPPYEEHAEEGGAQPEMTDEEAAAAYDAMTDDELRGHLATAMASQDFEMCVYLRDLLQSRATTQQQ
jgi:hypothetical protein